MKGEKRMSPVDDWESKHSRQSGQQDQRPRGGLYSACSGLSKASGLE